MTFHCIKRVQENLHKMNVCVYYEQIHLTIKVHSFIHLYPFRVVVKCDVSLINKIE